MVLRRLGRERPRHDYSAHRIDRWRRADLRGRLRLWVALDLTLDPLHARRQALTDLEIAALQREVSELRDSLSLRGRRSPLAARCGLPPAWRSWQVSASARPADE
jgi:hypothetical protein